jgi:histidyl-tRNA synthetase
MGSSKNKIEARILKGFRDELPADAEARNRLFRTITEMFELSGFSPIDTPALEYSEILLGKGSDETDKQLFRFQDQGGRDVSLRFDLTVPLARFVSMHQNDLIFPFKRYHIAPVWRAEKPQKGRYREFYQCDFDIIGSKSVTSDLEVLLVVHRFFSSLNIPYRVRVNNRKLLTGMLEAFGVSGDHTPSLRAIDKLEKLGKDKVIDELCSEASLTRDGASGLCDFISDLMHESDIDAGIRILKDRCPENALMEAGLREVQELFSGLAEAGISKDRSVLDISIARGLDYYTGLVFETQLSELPGIGSVCSGGRYDNLASLFTSRELPGVGGSVGIDRLLAALRELQPESGPLSGIKVLVSIFDERYLGTCIRITERLRNAGIASELYPDSGKPGAQIKYADKKGIPLVVILGEDEFSKEEVQIKDLRNTEGTAGQTHCPLHSIEERIKNILGL